jgi:hypothetical protein
MGKLGLINRTLIRRFLMDVLRLSPLKRVTCLLHDVFGFSFDEVGQRSGETQARAGRLQGVRGLVSGRPLTLSRPKRKQRRRRKWFVYSKPPSRVLHNAHLKYTQQNHAFADLAHLVTAF